MGNRNSKEKQKNLHVSKQNLILEDWNEFKFKFWFLEKNCFSPKKLIPKILFIRKERPLFGEKSNVIVQQLENKIIFPLTKEEIQIYFNENKNEILEEIKFQFPDETDEFYDILFNKDIKKIIYFKNKEKLIEEIFLQIHLFINNFDFNKILNFKTCKDHLKSNFERFSFGLILTDFLDSLTDSMTPSKNLQVYLIISILQIITKTK